MRRLRGGEREQSPSESEPLLLASDPLLLLLPPLSLPLPLLPLLPEVEEGLGERRALRFSPACLSTGAGAAATALDATLARPAGSSASRLP